MLAKGSEWGDASDTTDTGGGRRWDAKTMMADTKDHTSIRDLERAVVRKESFEEFRATNSTSTQEVPSSSSSPLSLVTEDKKRREESRGRLFVWGSPSNDVGAAGRADFFLVGARGHGRGIERLSPLVYKHQE